LQLQYPGDTDINDLEKLPIKVTEQLLTFTKTVSPKLNDLEEFFIKNAIP
jgi:hypothetical protein